MRTGGWLAEAETGPTARQGRRSSQRRAARLGQETKMPMLLIVTPGGTREGDATIVNGLARLG